LNDLASDGLWAGPPGFYSQQEKAFLFNIAFRSAMGPSQNLIQWIQVAISLGGEAAGD
jgi:hypothetical protein